MDVWRGKEYMEREKRWEGCREEGEEPLERRNVRNEEKDMIGRGMERKRRNERERGMNEMKGRENVRRLEREKVSGGELA